MSTFINSSRRLIKDKSTRILLVITLLVLAIGTIFYSLVEGWRMLDSLYFSVMALATVGLGDFHPATDAGKVFSMFYIIIGIGLLSALISRIFTAFKTNVENRKK